MEYNFNKWNVPIIQEPNELMKKLKEFNLIGKKITNIRCVGLCYDLTEDDIEDEAYNYYRNKNVENLAEISTYENIPLDTLLLRSVQIDEPIIFYFDNGDRLEVDYSEASSLKIGKNSLPKNIQYGTNIPNADMNIVFSNCLNKKIIGFEVSMSDELLDDFTGSHGIQEPENQMSYISSFEIKLEDWISIKFNNFFDYGRVYIESAFESEKKITWEELKKGIKNI